MYNIYIDNMNTCMYMQCIYFDLICMWMDGWMDGW